MTPAKRGQGGQPATTADLEEPTPAERRASMTWAQRLKRVFFGSDIETGLACGGAVRIIACIEDPDVIEKILTHLDLQFGNRTNEGEGSKTAEPVSVEAAREALSAAFVHPERCPTAATLGRRRQAAQGRGAQRRPDRRTHRRTTRHHADRGLTLAGKE